MKRPVSITVFGWLYLLSSLISAMYFRLGDAQATRFPLPVESAYRVLTILVEIVIAVGLLRGYAWARFLCVAQMVAELVFVALNFDAGPPGALALIVTAALAVDAVKFFVLYRAPAEAYFAGKVPARS